MQRRQQTGLSSYLTLEAGRDMRAPASSASSLPNTGAPNPLGQRRTMQVTSPPHESPFLRMSSMTAHHGLRWTAENSDSLSDSAVDQHTSHLCTSAQLHLCQDT